MLQELGWDRGPDSRKRPERLVDGCNTWFCEDMDLVRRIWQPDPSSAGLCVADLFIRFLRFYSEVSPFSAFSCRVLTHSCLTSSCRSSRSRTTSCAVAGQYPSDFPDPDR